MLQFKSVVSSCLVLFLCGAAIGQSMRGYLGVPNEPAPKEFGAGFSMYVAAWPLLEKWPGSRFQTGLFGTWMFAQKKEPKPEGKIYSDIEGGLGWWRDTRFATPTPKFIMGGVALNFSAWANGPGAGKGRDWSKPNGKYAVAQLSPWVLWPPDGLNLKQGTCGEMFGYGYLPLPLTDAKKTTAGHKVPTGNQCWTLFLNTKNFKGPLTFFSPYFFSRTTIDRPDLAGRFLDTQPSEPKRSLQMETQYIPAVHAKDTQGDAIARVAPTRFPKNCAQGSALVHRITSYKRDALWNSVSAWFQGGPEAPSTIDPKHSHLHKIPGRGWSTWKIYQGGIKDEKGIQIPWNDLVTPIALDDYTFGYQWNSDLVSEPKEGELPLVTLPQYFRQTKAKKGMRYTPEAPEKVASIASLSKATFGDPNPKKQKPYTTPTDGCWTTPGPVAGPFKVTLGDGSTVTYSWYRFADQPALQNADLSAKEREAIQERIERLHRSWTKDREYLPAPTTGTLASLDPALLVTPPKGFEIGYVPIVTRQE